MPRDMAALGRAALRARWGDRTPEQRFWGMVRKTDTCWLWTGAKTAFGYGNLYVPVGPDRRSPKVNAHRFSYELHFGPIPPGVEVCHHCDVPACVRPDHLFLGSRIDNIRDCMRKGRLNTPPRGANAAAKLTIEAAREIRFRRVVGGEMLRPLSDQFGISRTSVWQIAVGITY